MLYTLDHNPHYLNRYYSFINSIRNKGIRELDYKENHHIVPSYFEENNSLENRIDLTYREHFIAHLILAKCFFGKHRARMVCAIRKMLLVTNKHKILKNSKYYHELRRKFYNEYCKGENSSSYGRIVSDETRKKLSILNSGENHPQFGKLGKDNPNFGSKRTLEQRMNISKSRKGYKYTEAQRNALIERMNSPNFIHSNKGKRIGELYGYKISETLKAIPKIECKHCGKLSSPAMNSRWHGEKCKEINVR